AAYELESDDAVQTPEFLNRPATPLDRRMSPRVVGKNLIRIVGEQIHPEAPEQANRGMAPVLQIGRVSVRDDVDTEWSAWYNGEYIPVYRKVGVVSYVRRVRDGGV